MQDKEMLNELIVESREHLESIEPDLLELEQKGANVPPELINRVFRAVHSIKGGFGFFAVEPVVRLSHAMETVMSRVRDAEQPVVASLTDALLLGVDKLRTLLDDVGNADTIPVEDELARLAPFIENSPAPPAAGSAQGVAQPRETELSEHPLLSDTAVFDALRNGKHIYQVTLEAGQHLDNLPQKLSEMLTTWESFGDILDCVPPRSQLERKRSLASLKKPIQVVFATVLEADLIAEGLELASEQILSIDTAGYREKLARQDEKKSSQEPPDQGHPSSGVSAPRAQRTEPRIEEALRVKIGLLNSLMNQAGELVLGRNQLLQTMGRRFSDTPEAQRIITSFMDTIRTALEALTNTTEKEKRAGSARTYLPQLEKRLRDELGFSLGSVQGVNAIVQNINMVTSELQENIMQTRMQPLSVVFNKFPRIMRDLAKSVGKEITLTLSGQEVELDKSIIELLSDPLTHLIRNCADHGIETPQQRSEQGKSREGMVVLRACQEGGKVIIEIQDDGAGLDPARIGTKAVEKGVITREKLDTLSEREINALIFAPGFSTAETVSNISGRGVGMDVVRTNIERLGGTVEIESEKGQGTLVSMKLPLTLAIIPSLIVTAEDRRFAIPQVGLEEVVRIRAKDVTSRIERVHDSEVLRLRATLLPLVRLARVLDIEPTWVNPQTGEREPDHRSRWSDRRGRSPHPPSSEEAQKRTAVADRRDSVHNAVKVIVLRIDTSLFGLVVDDVLDSEEIVVKPLPDFLKGCQVYAGTTIMGDGRIAMILDPNGVAAQAQLRFDALEKELQKEQEEARTAARAQVEDMLLFSLGGPEHLAVSLASIARIEKRSRSEIERIGNSEFLHYENRSLRLVRLDTLIPVQPGDQTDESLLVIVPRHDGQPVGFVAQRVEDTVQTECMLDTHSVAAPGIAGSTIIGGNLTVVVDIPALLDLTRQGT